MRLVKNDYNKARFQKIFTVYRPINLPGHTVGKHCSQQIKSSSLEKIKISLFNEYFSMNFKIRKNLFKEFPFLKFLGVNIEVYF